MHARTQVKDIANTVLEDICSLPREKINLEEENTFQNQMDFSLEKEIKILVLIESIKVVNNLQVFLKGYLEDERDANKETLKAFLMHLNQRWDDINETPAQYPLAYHIQGTIAYWLLARRLSPLYSRACYRLLMPTITYKESDFPESLDEFRPSSLKKIVLSNIYQFEDQNQKIKQQIVIDVVKSLDIAAMETPNLTHHTYLIHKKPTPLMEDEAQRVVHHSQEARSYYTAIVINKDKEKKRKELIEAMASDTYEVTASYGEAGKKRLINLINRDDLIHVMTDYVPQSQWDKLIKLFSKESLEKIILNGEELSSVIKNKATYNGQNRHDKAILFCLTEIYWHRRNDIPASYTGIFGGLWGVDKGTREEDKNNFQAFLMSDYPLNEYATYLKSKGKERYRRAYMESNFDSLVYQAKCIGQPEFFADEKKESSFSQGVLNMFGWQ